MVEQEPGRVTVSPGEGSQLIELGQVKMVIFRSFKYSTCTVIYEYSKVTTNP